MHNAIASPSRDLHCFYKRGNDNQVTTMELFHQEWCLSRG